MRDREIRLLKITLDLEKLYREFLIFVFRHKPEELERLLRDEKCFYDFCLLVFELIGKMAGILLEEAMGSA